MRVGFGTDDHNECTRAVVEYLRSVAQVQVFDEDSWPEFAMAVGIAVASGDVSCGVVIC